jgi:hypothetical protein
MIVRTRGRDRIQGIITELAIITILILVLIGLPGKKAIAVPVAMETVMMVVTTIVMTTATTAAEVVQAVLMNVHIPARKYAPGIAHTKPAETMIAIPVWNGPASKPADPGKYARTETAFLLNALPDKPKRNHAEIAEKEPEPARAITNGVIGAPARDRVNVAQETRKPEIAETMVLKAEPAILAATGETGAPALERTKRFTFQLQPALQADALL